MIATVDVADIGRRSLVQAIRHRPAPGDVPGLRWLDLAPAAALASKKPPGFRRAVLRPLRAFGSWPGLPAEVPRNRLTHHDAPVIVTTLGRLRLTQTFRFLR